MTSHWQRLFTSSLSRLIFIGADTLARVIVSLSWTLCVCLELIGHSSAMCSFLNLYLGLRERDGVGTASLSFHDGHFLLFSPELLRRPSFSLHIPETCNLFKRFHVKNSYWNLFFFSLQVSPKNEYSENKINNKLYKLLVIHFPVYLTRRAKNPSSSVTNIRYIMLIWTRLAQITILTPFSPFFFLNFSLSNMEPALFLIWLSWQLWWLTAGLLR